MDWIILVPSFRFFDPLLTEQSNLNLSQTYRLGQKRTVYLVLFKVVICGFLVHFKEKFTKAIFREYIE